MRTITEIIIHCTATRQMRDRVERIMKEGLACDCCSAEIKALFTEWIANRECTLKTKEIADKLIPLMEACGCDIYKQFLELRHSLVKKSQWIFGGDGWGYDIGFGGLDHVLASGEDVNIVVVDTEVYSNTGGQSSKATNTSKIKSMTVKNAMGCFSIYGCSVLLGLRWG